MLHAKLLGADVVQNLLVKLDPRSELIARKARICGDRAFSPEVVMHNTVAKPV
jgi:hypothetical protein